jgi:phosphatidylglycerol:prolipoprotein diacylglycerol transferase
VLWLYTRKPRPTMAASGIFLIGYGAFRILVEFVRVPDLQLSYLALGWVTMGQVLSLPMVIAGVILFVLAIRRTDAERPAGPSSQAPAKRAS